jgi:spore coat protein JB
MFDKNKNKLTRKISKVQFVLHDLHLYLDTHPKDMQAIKHYEFYENKLEELTKEYEHIYGADKAVRGNAWTWIEGPWPWEREFNEE